MGRAFGSAAEETRHERIADAQPAIFSPKEASTDKLETMRFVEIEFGTELYQEGLRLREEVLRRPLGLRLSSEDLADDPECFHLGMCDEAKLVAVLLLQRVSTHRLKMRQVAVSPDAQGSGIGSELLARAERFAQERRYRTVHAHARESAIGFYLKHGYVASGEVFREQMMPHRLITKDLSAK